MDFQTLKKLQYALNGQTVDTSNINNVPQKYENKNVVYQNDLQVLADQKNVSNITSDITWNENINYPIKPETVVGKVTYKIDGKNYSVNLLNSDTILPIANNKSISYIYYILIGILVIIIIITIIRIKKKKSKKPKYFRHSFY